MLGWVQVEKSPEAPVKENFYISANAGVTVKANDRRGGEFETHRHEFSPCRAEPLPPTSAYSLLYARQQHKVVSG